MRPVAAAVLIALAAVACRPRQEAPAPAGSGGSSAAVAAPPPPAVAKETPPPACPPVDPAKRAPFTCDERVVKGPVPPIEDAKDTLAPFWDKLAALSRGTARKRLRIGVYGDSNLTSDFLTGQLRRVLQERFGDAGHGYVSLSKPWGSYHHEDVENAGYWAMFHLYAPTTHIARDRQYGFANMAAESADVGAAAWVGTTKNRKAKVGRSANRFELYYLKQPRGGSFRVLLDGKEERTIGTEALEFEAGFDVVETTDDAHELRCVVRGDGPVRFFGASVDRDVPGGGIQIDSLGAGSLNYERLRWVADGTRRVQLARRAYDLVILWLGANIMWVPPNDALAKEFIGQLRAATPGVPILILSPADGVRGDETKTDPRILELVAQMRKVAVDTDSAYWDLRAAMGGDGSIVRFTKRGLTGEDHIHFGPEGSAFMANRLLCATWDAFGAHLERSPRAGCPAPP